MHSLSYLTQQGLHSMTSKLLTNIKELVSNLIGVQKTAFFNKRNEL
jgi:hypothetical protein